MHDTDSPDVSAAIGPKTVFDGLRVYAAPPVSLEKLCLDAELVSHLLPECGEVACLDHQNALAFLDQIGKRRLPCTGAGSRVNDDRRVCLENSLHAIEAFPAEFGKGRPAMVDGRMIHRAQNPVRNIGRAGNLKKMPACLIVARSHVR